MLLQYHESITRKALSERFSPRAMKAVVAANLRQDHWLTGQMGHPQFHFDNNAFKKSYAYIEGQRALAVSSLQDGHLPAAWAAFGRLAHAVQDFYAHTNYVDLWLAWSADGDADDRSPLPPSEIAHDMDELVNSPNLRSGKLYYPLEVFSFVPFFKRFVTPFLPEDSHAWMNLDSPERGRRFEYAFEAALKRTRDEFDQTVAGLSSGQVALFADRLS